MRVVPLTVLLGAGAALGCASACAQQVAPNGSPWADVEGEAPPAPAFRVREGYELSAATGDLGEARFLEFGAGGVLYVSAPGTGSIWALRDRDGDGVYEQRATFVSGMRTAHGMHFVDGWLWFTQTRSVHKGRDTDGDGAADEIVTVLPDGSLPGGSGHWWRAILVTGDSFYTAVGDSGNITDEAATERQKIWRYDLDGSNKRLFASGIRNTEKLRLRPGTDEIWGADHGSDNFGARLGERMGRRQPVTDWNPPDEFNHYVEGGFYGHPFIVGDKLPRYEHRERADILDLAERTIPPRWKFAAHAATNGFTFVETRANASPGALPADHAGDAFVACHGSWNRTEKVGYEVVRVLLDDGRPYGMLTIIHTLAPDWRTVLGRPVDCVQAPDGSLLFSCDYTNRVYRIRAAATQD